MTEVSVTVQGLDQFRKALRRMSPAQQRDIIESSLLECAQRIQANAKDKQILGGGAKAVVRGRGVQIKPHPTKLTHRTRTLSRAIAVDLKPPSSVDVGVLSGTNSKALRYAAVHEFGTMGFPRPFIQPALEAVEGRFPEVFLRHWRRVSGE